MAMLERNFFFIIFVECIKYGMNPIAAVIHLMLLNQNSNQESINVIFPASCLYVHPYLDACIIIIQTLTKPEDSFMSLPFSCLSEFCNVREI